MSEASFDSNILIDTLNGYIPAKSEIDRVARPFISRIVWIEVMSKVRQEDDSRMDAFFADFNIDEVTIPISRGAARLRLNRPKLKLADAVILASAQLRGHVLVTRNTKDFPVGMSGIRVPYVL